MQGKKIKMPLLSSGLVYVFLGKETPEWTQLNNDKLTVLSSSRHSKKLRTGALLGNRFVLTLRNITDVADVESRLQQIAAGVPNYFGEQRFGHDGKNLVMGRQMR
ncbi:tRNA pseudouridine(13) synthase TruD [Paucibacter sp. O1-1]|nr:tRNA pseudouridine(13) synthase TruD [Paucibacter sp. O1-1]MDA3824463.1 tRNA pseudouridine(13) synthase TruD [Paucibacter sp. O1-1]